MLVFLQIFPNFSEPVICRTPASDCFCSMLVKHLQVLVFLLDHFFSTVVMEKKFDSESFNSNKVNCPQKSQIRIKTGKVLRCPTNTPHVFHVETTWKQPFPRHFNVEYTWCVCKWCLIILWTLGLIGLFKCYESLSETFVIFIETFAN